MTRHDISAPTEPGVYIMRNTSNGKTYVGSSRNLRQRIFHHLWGIKSGKHPNHRIRRDLANCTLADFRFEIVSIVHDDRERTALEQQYIDDLNPVYNLSLNADSTRDMKKQYCLRGHELTPENTWSRPNDPSIRQCLICRNASPWRNAKSKKNHFDFLRKRQT